MVAPVIGLIGRVVVGGVARAATSLARSGSSTKDAIRITVTPPLTFVRGKFQGAFSALRDFTQPHKETAVFLDQWVQRNFREEGGRVGGWAPFARGGRWRKGYGLDTSAKLLQDTGQLRSSFSPFASKRDAGIGSPLPYSKRHHEGLGHLPARRMLPKLPEVKKDVEQIFDAHVKRGLKKMELP